MVTRTAQRVRWRKRFLLIILAGVLGLNGVAFMQAHAMTHYASGGERTSEPEALSLLGKVWTVVAGVNVPRPKNFNTPQAMGLQYETHLISVGGEETLEAWYVPHPQPREIVLMYPGYAASKESLLAPAVVFHDLQYDVLLVDFRGAGGSSGEDTTLGMREARDVAVSVAYTRHAWPDRPVVLYGGSMGAAAIMRAVAKEDVRPDVVILESPFDTLVGTVRNRFHAIGLPAFPGAELMVFWGSVQQGYNGFDHNPVDYAQSVTCPALLLHGDQDPRVTPEQTAAIYKRLAGEKQFVSFPGAGHGSLIASAPEEWKQGVQQFLEEAK